MADRCGATIGFHDGLNAIEGDAVSLGQEAHQRLTLCEDEIRALAEAVATTAPIAKARAAPRMDVSPLAAGAPSSVG